jgi:hypothetical protein
MVTGEPFRRFLERFAITDGGPPGEGLDGGVFSRFGGRTFERGLYRVHTQRSADEATELVNAAYPDFGGRFSCFGYDWLGRQFAMDSGRGEPADPQVMMLEPGTGEALEIDVAFSRFHDEELVDYSEAALAAGFFDEWMAIHRSPLALDECAGYRRPLYLGGEDVVANLELSDLSVYWTLTGQLRVRTLGLPPGTRVSAIHLED